jgi:isopenicillin N synthase-like dioxygenase
MNFETIKMLNFKQASFNDKQDFGNKIVNHCKQNGFLVLKESYISIEKQKEMFALADNFFKNITPAIREEIKYNKLTNRGLASIGAEALDEHSIDIKETYNIGFEGTEVPNLFTKNPDFRDFNKVFLDYAEACYLNIQDLLRALALGCNMDEDFFVNKHNRNSQTLRLLHYPTIKNTKEKYAVSPHTDYGTLTMVLQESVAGLSVQNLKTKEWHDVNAEIGCAVINIGDLLMRWSNDVLQSNPHKADYKDSGKSGYMTAFFAHPSYEEIISCLPAFKGEQELYEPIKSLDYLNMRISSTYK